MNTLKKSFLIAVLFLLSANDVFARGGGGGSGGGGGGGGFGGGGSIGFVGSSSTGGSFGSLGFVVVIIIFLIIVIVGKILQSKQLKKREIKEVGELEAAHIDVANLKNQVGELFQKFETAWGGFDLPTMQSILTENYYKRMVLELNVLQNEHRSNPMQDLHLYAVLIYDVDDNTPDHITVRITAGARDTLMDTAQNQELFVDTSGFTEYWHLIKQGNNWKLDLITQETEDPARVESDIASFAEKNNFYFDPDFGWLMMPNKGVIFNKTNFGRSDINNHVIGYFRNKIVEFYTYIPNPQQRGSTNYLVAQAILPKSYYDILIRKKRLLSFGVWGLKKVSLESADFNKKFEVYANENDQVNSLELLAPNFMERIYNLPFDLNIELVGNFLYFYTKDRGQATYENMLEVISWAFDEMKM